MNSRNYYDDYDIRLDSELSAHFVRSNPSDADNKQVSGYSLRLGSNPRFARTSDTCPPLGKIQKIFF